MQIKKSLTLFFLVSFSTVLWSEEPATESSGQTPRETVIIAYNSFLLPPFVDGTGGLAKDLVDYLNSDMRGEYRFVLQNIPQDSLIDTKIKSTQGFRGIALFQNPENIGRRTGLLWSATVFDDSQVLVFRTTNAPRSAGTGSLTGLTYGAVSGSSYPLLDRLAGDNLMTRRDSANETDLVGKLLAGSVDLIPVSGSYFAALSAQPQYTGKISALRLPGSASYHRRIVFGIEDATLAARVEIAIARMTMDEAWNALVKKYGIVQRVALW